MFKEGRKEDESMIFKPHEVAYNIARINNLNNSVILNFDNEEREFKCLSTSFELVSRTEDNMVNGNVYLNLISKDLLLHNISYLDLINKDYMNFITYKFDSDIRKRLRDKTELRYNKDEDQYKDTSIGKIYAPSIYDIPNIDVYDRPKEHYNFLKSQYFSDLGKLIKEMKGENRLWLTRSELIDQKKVYALNIRTKEFIKVDLDTKCDMVICISLKVTDNKV